MSKKPILLIIIDKGDPSVGINECHWEVVFPLELDTDKLSEDDKCCLEDFKQDIKKAYECYCDGSCVVEYDFEFKYKYDEH